MRSVICSTVFALPSSVQRLEWFVRKERDYEYKRERYEQKEKFVISQCRQQISGILRITAMLLSGEKQKSSKGTFEGLANRVFKKWYKHSTQSQRTAEVRAKTYDICRTMVQWPSVSSMIFRNTHVAYKRGSGISGSMMLVVGPSTPCPF